MSLEKTPDREIKKDPRTGIYHYRGTPHRGGKEIMRSLGVRTFRSAVSAKKDLLLRMRGIDPGAKDILFIDYAKVFLEERKKRALKTFELATFSIKELSRFFESYSMRSITDRSWAEYVDYQSQVKPGRLLRYDRRHMLMMLLRLKKKGIISELPELPIEDPGSKKKRVLTEAEISKIMDRASGSIFGLALFMHKMGARPGEVFGSRWTEFDLEKGIWNIPAERVKTRQARSIKLNTSVQKWLEGRVGLHKSDFVFPSKDSRGASPLHRYNKQWKRLMEACGLPKEITPYYLRHTFLTECAKKVREGKISLVMITKYAGTSIDEFERTYLHIEGEDTKEVAEMMEL